MARKGFDPNQPRNAEGEWTKVAGYLKQTSTPKLPDQPEKLSVSQLNEVIVNWSQSEIKAGTWNRGRPDNPIQHIVNVRDRKERGPMTRARVIGEIQNKDIELRQMADESGAPYYTPKELIGLREDDVKGQLAMGYGRIVVKVPSGSEVQFSPEAATQLLGSRASASLRQKYAPVSDSSLPAGSSIKPSPGGLFKAFKPSGMASFFDSRTEAEKWLRGESAQHHDAGSVYIPGKGVVGGSRPAAAETTSGNITLGSKQWQDLQLAQQREAVRNQRALAGTGEEARLTQALAGIPKGKGRSFKGVKVDNIPSKGLRVRIGSESRHYSSAADAAVAIRSGRHNAGGTVTGKKK